MSIEEYLRELDRHLRAGLLARRRILSEIEAHAREAMREERERGQSYAEAERRAIERLGPPDELATRFGEVRGRRHKLPALGAALVVAATCAVVAWGVTLGLEAGHQKTRTIPPVRRVDYSYVRRVTLANEQREAARIARTVCGGKHTEQRCISVAVKNLFRDRAFPSCGNDPGVVYVGHGTWRTPHFPQLVRRPDGTYYFTECDTLG